MNNDDFYIGYLKQAPEGVRRFTKKTVIALLAGVMLVAVLLVLGQKAFYPSTFEFLQYKEFTGTFHSHPYPMLRVLDVNGNGDIPTYSHYYLVNEGKFGSQDLAQEYEGQQVALEGTLIYRDDQVMVEIKPGTIKSVSDAEPATSPAPQSLGTFTLAGEIVDSKCFLGVMNPGSQKPHRACATRCISGGVPPLFVAKDAEGKTSYLALQSSNGSVVNQDVLEMVAEPLEITGEVFQVEDVLIFRADPATYKRLSL
ncbi:MAG: hypothetical protein AB8G77_19650 [Rhodothermales bacterium]